MGVWGVVILVLYVMRVIRGVPLRVVCVFRRVDVVCLLCAKLLFSVRCFVLSMFCVLYKMLSAKKTLNQCVVLSAVAVHLTL